MELKMPAVDRERFWGAIARVNSLDVRVWAEGQPDAAMGDPRILATAFTSDPPSIRQKMIQRILASEIVKNSPGFGGAKVRAADVWNSPEGKLLTLRALMFFCKHYDVERAFTVDRWANVIQRFDYSSPHCHYESKAAVVYYLDLGEEVPDYPLSGRFELLDSRVPFCCSRGPHAPTRGIIPELIEGSMIMFPAEFIHHVHPYMGNRPRITLAWNISEGLQPAGHEDTLTQRVDAELGPPNLDSTTI
jgi:hypothetical protein